jgi:hypothetical protein
MQPYAYMLPLAVFIFNERIISLHHYSTLQTNSRIILSVYTGLRQTVAK